MLASSSLNDGQIHLWRCGSKDGGVKDVSVVKEYEELTWTPYLQQGTSLVDF